MQNYWKRLLTVGKKQYKIHINLNNKERVNDGE